MYKIYIKNMVCDRCVMVVKDVLTQHQFTWNEVLLGEVELKEELNETQRQELAKSLTSLGFEMIGDKRGQTIEKIKNILIQQIYKKSTATKQNISVLLAETLHQDYAYLSSIFSEIEGKTIEKYYIAQKIERVKELLVYDELTLSQIADIMEYSSAAYLSNQFKKITGLTPSHFKEIKTQKRNAIDKL